jgi:hypothetical protein
MKQLLRVTVCAAIVCWSIPSIALAQTGVSFNPPVMESPNVAQQFTINIDITNATDVFGYQIAITFDPTALSYVSVQNGEFLAGSIGPPTLPPNVEDGEIKFGATLLGAVPGVNGDGTLATVTFEVVAVKTSTLGLDVKIIDSNDQRLDLVTEAGTITGAPLEAVITEPAGDALSFEATISSANMSAKGFIALWEGEMEIQAGMSLEYQVMFSEISVHTEGGVYVHAADGNIVGLVDDDAGSDWKHRKVSLDDFAGSQIVAITVGTDNGENPDNPAGLFGMMVDNVQITSDAGIITKVWVDENSIGGAQEVTAPFGDSTGVEDLRAFISAVSVDPQSTMLTTWGHLKAVR